MVHRGGVQKLWLMAEGFPSERWRTAICQCPVSTTGTTMHRVTDKRGCICLGQTRHIPNTYHNSTHVTDAPVFDRNAILRGDLNKAAGAMRCHSLLRQLGLCIAGSCVEKCGLDRAVNRTVEGLQMITAGKVFKGYIRAALPCRFLF